MPLALQYIDLIGLIFQWLNTKFEYKDFFCFPKAVFNLVREFSLLQIAALESVQQNSFNG